MTETKDSDEDLAGKVERVRVGARRLFGQAIFSASKAYEDALAELSEAEGIRIRDVQRTADLNDAMAVTAFLGSAFLGGGVLDFDSRQTLARLKGSLRPPTHNKTEALDAAHALVAEYATLYADAVARNVQPAPNGVLSYDLSPAQLADSLAMCMTAEIHAGFSVLRGRAADMQAILGRWRPTRATNPPRGQDSGLNATGVLYELDKLAAADGSTFGPLQLTGPKVISNAVSTMKELRLKHEKRDV